MATASTSIQKWGAYDPAEAERDKKETEKKGVFFKITKEKTVLRFLPPRQGARNPFVKTYQHYAEMIEGDDRTVVIANCPRKMMKRRCPICQMAEEAKSTGRKADKDRAYDLFPKLRVYAAIIDRSDPDKGVQTYAFGQKVFQQLLNIRDDVDFTHPLADVGCDVTIIKKGTKKNDIEYMVKAHRKTSALSDDPEQFDEWIEALPDLTQVAYVPTDEELREKMGEAIDAADGEEEESERPARGRERSSGGAGGGGGGRSRERPRRDSIDTTGEEVSDSAWSGAGTDEDEEDDDIPY